MLNFEAISAAALRSKLLILVRGGALYFLRFPGPINFEYVRIFHQSIIKDVKMAMISFNLVYQCFCKRNYSQ